MNDALIISIKEFRKIVGKEAEQFSDEQVAQLIVELDFIAELFVKHESKGEYHDNKQG